MNTNITTALNFRTYKYKINGLDTIVWRPADNKVKYGLFQQDKNGNFTVDVLHKYYNIPPYNSKFNLVYENIIQKEVIVELSIKDILTKVKHKLKHFKAEIFHLKKTSNGKFSVPLFPDARENISKNLHKPDLDIRTMSKNELKLLLAYLWPHENKDKDSEITDIDAFIDKFKTSKSTSKDIYVDKEAYNYLQTGFHGIA